MTDLSTQSGDAITKRIADAPYHLTGENRFGERSLVTYGELEDVQAIFDITSPESKPVIEKNA